MEQMLSPQLHVQTAYMRTPGSGAGQGPSEEWAMCALRPSEFSRHFQAKCFWRGSGSELGQHLHAETSLCWQRSVQSKLWFSSSHVQMWELDHKEGWAPKNWCFWTVVLEKNLESPLVCQEVKSVNPKGNQLWIFIGRTDAEAPIIWLPEAKIWLIGKDPDG